MGIYLITAFIFLLAVVISIELGILLLNEYIDNYYILISFVCLIPLYVGCLLHFCYGRTKSYRERANLTTGCVLAAISIWFYEFYSFIYFKDKYEYDEVYFGAGSKENPGNYHPGFSKQSFAISKVVEFVVYECLLVYFIYVTCKWQGLTNRK